MKGTDIYKRMSVLHLAFFVLIGIFSGMLACTFGFRNAQLKTMEEKEDV